MGKTVLKSPSRPNSGPSSNTSSPRPSNGETDSNNQQASSSTSTGTTSTPAAATTTLITLKVGRGKGKGGKGKPFGFGGVHASLRGQGTSAKDIKMKKASDKSTPTSSENKKKRPKKQETYDYYIFKVLKQIHQDSGISKRAMSIMNSFITDIFERLANEASVLSQRNKAKTILTRDIQTATRLLLPGELGKHALSEASNAVNRYLNASAK